MVKYEKKAKEAKCAERKMFITVIAICAPSAPTSIQSALGLHNVFSVVLKTYNNFLTKQHSRFVLAAKTQLQSISTTQQCT
jgi:hypothetical protein